MSERKRRVAENELLFGAVNEQLDALTERFPERDGRRFSIVCECGNERCTERIEIDVADYRRAKEEPARFVVLEPHVIPDTERVLERGDGYVVVEKNEPIRSEIESSE